MRLALLDYLRFAAAFFVVLYHWFAWGILNGKNDNLPLTDFAHIAIYGYLGVHLFFLISGFVIARSADGKSASKFFVGRARRLFPAYWFAVTLGFLVILVSSARQLVDLLPSWMANLTMVPQLFGYSYVDGIYWTLFYELTFYALVGLLLLFGQGKRLSAVMPWWAIVMFVVVAFVPQLSGLPFLGGYYPLFAGGAMLAATSERGWTPLRAIGLLASLASTLLYASQQFVVKPELENLEGFTYSIPLVLVLLVLFYVVVWLQTVPAVAAWRLPASKTLGLMTYPVYLTQGVLGYWIIQSLVPATGAVIAVFGASAGVLVVSWLLHHVVEVRMRPMWDRLFAVLVGTPVSWLEIIVQRLRGQRARAAS